MHSQARCCANDNLFYHCHEEKDTKQTWKAGFLQHAVVEELLAEVTSPVTQDIGMQYSK